MAHLKPIREKTLVAWMEKHLPADQRAYIAKHGATAETPKTRLFTRQTWVLCYVIVSHLAQRFEDEVWKAVARRAERFGYNTPWDFVAQASTSPTFDRFNFTDWLVLRALEEICDSEADANREMAKDGGVEDGLVGRYVKVEGTPPESDEQAEEALLNHEAMLPAVALAAVRDIVHKRWRRSGRLGGGQP